MIRKILITGGTGFIGSHTCLKFLEEGFNIYIADSFINSSKKVFGRIKKIADIYGFYDQKKINILKKDNPNSLAKRILAQEHKLYPKAILKIFSL